MCNSHKPFNIRIQNINSSCSLAYNPEVHGPSLLIFWDHITDSFPVKVGYSRKGHSSKEYDNQLYIVFPDTEEALFTCIDLLVEFGKDATTEAAKSLACHSFDSLDNNAVSLEDLKNALS